jgi:pilus assembly protein CpaC
MRSFRLALLTGATIAVAGMALPALVVDARAQSRAATVSEAGQTLTLAAGKSAIIDLPRDAAEIFVGNPKVANAVVRTPRRLFVMGVDNGQTSIYALDKDGNRFLNLDLRVGRDVGELNQILRSALPNTKIYGKTVNDSIILLGEADSALEIRSVSAARSW